MTSVVPFVLEQLIAPDATKAAIFADFSADPDIWDQPARDLEWLLHRHLIGVSWEWPWLTYWEDQFSQLGAQPRAWPRQSVVKNKIERELGPYDQRITILAGHMFHLHYALGRYQRNTSLKWCNFSPTTDEPEPIQALAQRYIVGYYTGDGPPILPPFFPGDTTIWAFTPTPVRRIYGQFNCRFREDSEFAPTAMQSAQLV